jgi:hypothetical protein
MVEVSTRVVLFIDLRRLIRIHLKYETKLFIGGRGVTHLFLIELAPHRCDFSPPPFQIAATCLFLMGLLDLHNHRACCSIW